MNTPTVTAGKQAVGKSQKPMGFSEFNHCIDVLLANKPDTSLSQGLLAAEMAAAEMTANMPGWEPDLGKATRQVA